MVSDISIIELADGGQRSDRFTFPLLGTDRSPLDASLAVHADSVPNLSVQTSRTSFRTLSGLVVTDPPAGLDLPRTRVQPTLTLSNGSVYPLGVLMFGADNRSIYAAHQEWSPELFDETFLLDQDLPDTYSLAAGGSVLTLFALLASQVLDPLGVPHLYDVDDQPAANPIPFKVGTSRNAALIALAALLGALPPFFDNQGVYRLKKPASAGSAPDHTYGVGTRIFDGTTTTTDSAYKAPNRYIVTGDDVSGAQVRGVFDLPANAPNSYAQTGRIVTAPIHNVPGVKDQALAAEIAYVDALTDRTTYSTISWSAAADPRHDIFDTASVLDVPYLETGWTLGLVSGGDHAHAGTQVFG